MKYDEFAFLNQQLAAMLRDGIPLEGALKRLCAEMRQGALRSELEKLEAGLSAGTPLADALSARELPDLYKRLLLVGARSNDMPGVLNLLADHYQRQHNLLARLKGLMVYPAIVLVMAFVVSVVFYLVWGRMLTDTYVNAMSGIFEGPQLPAMTRASFALMRHLWVFPFFTGLIAATFATFVCVPGLRRAAEWRLPAFREARLAHTASAIGMLLKGGTPFADAIHLAREMEDDARARDEISAWSTRLASGVTKFSEVGGGGKFYPPLFVWLVSSAGEDLAAGFRQASDIYQSRAVQRAEVLLYAALPTLVLALGVLILAQGWIVMSGLAAFMNLLGGTGG